MINALNRLLKLADVLIDQGELEDLNRICAQGDAYINRHMNEIQRRMIKLEAIMKTAHFEPKNDGTTPNPWRKNMDYSSEEHSPYFGSVGDFLKKFPGGIKDWVEWRKKTKKERFKKFDNRKERKAYLEILMKEIK